MNQTTAFQQVSEFILSTFQDTLKEPSGELHHPYISPGGPYATNLWDWDSYWTLYAIFKTYDRRGNAAGIEALRKYARGTLLNFLEHQGKDGALPIELMLTDADRFDCLKSADNNMAKPFIGQLARLLFEYGQLSKEELEKYLPQIRAYHQCFFNRYLDRRTGLIFCAKDWGLGVDDDPAVWGRPYKSCASLFLNCFLYCDMQAAAELAAVCGDSDTELFEKSNARNIADAIRKYCWDEREKSFFSVDLQCNVNLVQLKNTLLNKNLETFWNCLKLKILSWNCILPFWAGIGTKEQFDAFIRENFTDDRLRSDYGIRSLSCDESMYAPGVKRGNPSNWLGPLWIIATYLTVETLKKYGHTEEARKQADGCIAMLARDLEKNGTFHEYYLPETGEPVHNPGFMSWNALAALMG